MTVADHHTRVLAGDTRAIASAISLVEDGDPAAPALLSALHPHTGRATVVGVTGAGGSGKSTVVDQMIAGYRSSGARVGVLAVDPSSPFTGGAMLGDRIRMQRHAGDDRVFIRSLASRGDLGGVTLTTSDVITVLDAAGYDPILVETVGVGQGEVDVAGLADTTVVVVAPGAGDDVQAMKAGIMEIADIFVVNKADREGADRVAAAIEGHLSLVEASFSEWRPPVLSTVATSGDGVPELLEAIATHGRATQGSRPARRRARAIAHVRQLVLRRLMDRVPASAIEAAVDQVLARTTDPHMAAGVVASGVTASDAVWLDHVAVATSSLSESAAVLTAMFGLAGGAVEEVPSQLVRVQFLRGGDGGGQTALELIEPTSSESSVARFLASRGPGLHHVALRVANLVSVLGALRARGVRLVDEQPRAGAHGSLVAFIHPSATHGVLVELVEAGRTPRADR